MNSTQTPVSFLTSTDANCMPDIDEDAWKAAVTIDPAAPPAVLLALARERLSRIGEVVGLAAELAGRARDPCTAMLASSVDPLLQEAAILLAQAAQRLAAGAGSRAPCASVHLLKDGGAMSAGHQGAAATTGRTVRPRSAPPATPARAVSQAPGKPAALAMQFGMACTYTIAEGATAANALQDAGDLVGNALGVFEELAEETVGPASQGNAHCFWGALHLLRQGVAVLAVANDLVVAEVFAVGPAGGAP